jgi:hypothetical protein
MINFFKKLWEDFIISRYVSVGLQWGDAESYSFMGECVGYKSLCRALERLETQLEELKELADLIEKQGDRTVQKVSEAPRQAGLDTL